MHITGKGGKERLVPALAIVSAAIETYMALCPYPLEPDAPLFRGARGGPLSPRLIQLAMEKLRLELDLPETATPHALRHSFATQVYTEVDRERLLAVYDQAHPRAARR
jgi:integrase/recombinase XerC